MNFRKFVSSLSLVFILYSIVELAFANADEKPKRAPGKYVTSSGASHQGNVPMKEHPEKVQADSQQALEEIKEISQLLDKKTSINRNIIIGTAATNIALLLFLSGLLGYNTRKFGGDDEGKPEKKDAKDESSKDTDDQ